MNDFSEREPYTFFGHTAVLSIEERNDLDEYLNGLPEFREWDETGFLLGLRQKLLRDSVRSGRAAGPLDETCERVRLEFRRYKELAEILRRKVKTWCRAMVDVAT